MKIIRKLCVLALFLIAVQSLAQQSGSGAHESKYVEVKEYDPARDAAADLTAAVAEATRTHKRILLEVGGDWCSWCHIMDGFFEANDSLWELRNRNFVVVKINFGPKNMNEKFLSHYPEISGYPHIIVLEQDGKWLKSQATGEFENGHSYDVKRWAGFLNKWATVKKCPDLKDCGKS